MSNFKEVDDIQVLKAAIDGDPDAFGELYERNAAVIFRFLYAHIGNHLDAEDLTEDIFIRVWRSLPAYQEHGVPFLAYMFRVARHALIDHYRKSSQKQQPVSADEGVLLDHQPGPAEAVFASLEQQHIQELLKRLNDDYRTVLVLRFLLDLSTEEAAQAMGRSAGAVRVLQHRALRAMRNLLEDK